MAIFAQTLFGLPAAYRWVWLPTLISIYPALLLFEWWWYRRKGMRPPRWSWNDGFRWRDLVWFAPLMAGLIYLRFR